jgi:hypothetical protein
MNFLTFSFFEHYQGIILEEEMSFYCLAEYRSNFDCKAQIIPKIPNFPDKSFIPLLFPSPL